MELLFQRLVKVKDKIGSFLENLNFKTSLEILDYFPFVSFNHSRCIWILKLDDSIET